VGVESNEKTIKFLYNIYTTISGGLTNGQQGTQERQETQTEQGQEGKEEVIYAVRS
jgi:hypothetical protein